MAFSERDLACLLRVMYLRKWNLREHIGLFSFDDTPIKEVLAGGITTISTDFARMGETAAQLITQGKTRRIVNPWVLHDRGSL
jgi:DNA-binding LacI/PurR family transcriptional regulator